MCLEVRQIPFSPSAPRHWQISCLKLFVDLGKTKKILYVEDDEVALTAYRNRLQADGFYVETARDGVEAMKILSMSVPDLVIIDLMLPRFNGDEVLKFMQANPSLRSVPFMILSTNSIRDIAAEPLLEKASRRFLKESCDIQALLEAVREQLCDYRRKRIPVEAMEDFVPAQVAVA